jgi:hypothetical protein
MWPPAEKSASVLAMRKPMLTKRRAIDFCTIATTLCRMP